MLKLMHESVCVPASAYGYMIRLPRMPYSTVLKYASAPSFCLFFVLLWCTEQGNLSCITYIASRVYSQFLYFLCSAERVVASPVSAPPGVPGLMAKWNNFVCPTPYVLLP